MADEKEPPGEEKHSDNPEEMAEFKAELSAIFDQKDLGLLKQIKHCHDRYAKISLKHRRIAKSIFKRCLPEAFLGRGGGRRV